MGRVTKKIAVLAVAPVSLISFVLLGSDNDPARARPAAQALKPNSVPAAYEPWVRRAGELCPDVPPGFIAAQLEAESNWNPTATSGAGAQGIAQFMPGTWPNWGRDADGNGRTSPFDPADAIMAQGHYMCSLAEDMRNALNKDQVTGDVLDLALAGYNAGAGAVLQFNGIPPYEETRNYVRKIRRLAQEKAASTAPSATGWLTPTDGVCTSGFGPRGGEMHQGQDIAGPIGTPIRATSSGTVLDAGPASGYGLWVKLQHPEGAVTIYGHNHRNLVGEGDPVEAGQPIAEIGSRGQSSGPHLHYQVQVHGTPTDPVAWHQRQGTAALCD